MAEASSSNSFVACTCIDQLLLRISKLRKMEISIANTHSIEDPDDFTVIAPTDKQIWAKMFVEYFLGDVHCSLPQCSAQSDDMLWYVKQPMMGFFIGARPNGGMLDVHRRQSKKQPTPGDSSVNWEETVYLNLLLQQAWTSLKTAETAVKTLEYTVTCAVCTKTSPQNLQILRKNSQRVYASPSRRRMDSKGEGEEISYPNIYFAIDNFQEIFSDVVVRDGECVCVELVARDRYNHRESAVFLGSIRYEVLKQVYDSRASNTWMQKLMTTNQRRQEFVRMRGPHGKGSTQLLGSIRYEVLKQVYDSRASNTWMQKLMTTNQRRQEFVRMRGPHGKGSTQLLGSIRYEVLKQVYDSRASNTWMQKLMTTNQRRQEFVRMRGPHGKGSTQLLGSIRYEVLKQVYDSRASNTWMQKLMTTNQRRQEFVRMRGPHGKGSTQLLGSIRYEVLKQVYDSRASNTWMQKLMTTNQRRQEFVRMRGPHGKGSTQLLGSIRYEVLKQVYDSRASNTWMQKLMTTNQRRQEFVRMRGPHGKGSTQLLGSIRYEVLKQVYDSRASNTWMQKLMTTNQRRQEFVRMRGPHGKGSTQLLGSIRYEVLKQVYDSRASNTWMQKLMTTNQRRQEFVRMRGPHGKGSTQLLGSIRYEVLKQVYDSRASNTWMQKLMTTNQRRQEFVRMRGPHGKGFAEMAVQRVPGCGFETPTQEELPFEDFEVQAVESYQRRRMSDNNLSAQNYYRYKGSPVRKSQSEADYMEQYPEVEAQSIDDELEEGVFGRLWTMRGFGQAWHWLREKRRAASTPLHSFLTYVTLPWQSLLQDLLDQPRRPVLYFDIEDPPRPSPSS